MSQTKYDPSKIESKWYSAWEKNKVFSPSGKGESYCIMIPPPNVTGTFHIGHAFQVTLMDILCRYKRMCGFNTCLILPVIGKCTQTILRSVTRFTFIV